MTAIWQNDESGWHLLSPTGFPKEEKLHTLVEKAPHLLPLAGSPRLIVPGREGCMNCLLAIKRAEDKCRGRFIVPIADLSAHDSPLADQKGYSLGTYHWGR